jgi:predicted ABC-type ATPase
MTKGPFLMENPAPKIAIIAGPNGAGKSTTAKRLLPESLQIREFVNADVIAAGLSAFAPENVAFEAGRIMLVRLKELAASRENFSFETTLATRTYAPWLKTLQAAGYEVHLFFVWLPSADMAIARVAERVRSGGHHVPDETIRRRYTRALVNLRELYIPLANFWQLIDNSAYGGSRIIAAGGARRAPEIYLEPEWRLINEVEAS